MSRMVLMLGAMAMASASVAQDAWEVAKQLDLVPTPQEISLSGEQFDLDGWTIVTGRESATVTAAVGEINDRIAALGGEALPVASEIPAEGGAIAIGVWDDAVAAPLCRKAGVSISADDPGPQGYVIETSAQGGEPVIACVGSDEIGALYAAVTLRQMIQVRDGSVVVLEGSVRDWPDFQWRCNGNAGLRDLARGFNPDDPEQFRAKVGALKREMDRFLRMKVNNLHVRTMGLAEDETIAAGQQEVIDYAAARGIFTRDVSGTQISGYLSEEQKEQAFEPRENRFYLWSALDAHREQARDLAEAFVEMNTRMMALHPVDSGAYIDPEKWSERPAPDRERYGDDRAAASIEQFKLYFDIIRDVSPDTMLEAVAYPYHFQFALPDFPQRYHEMNVSPYRNWWRAIENEQQAREVRQRLIDYHTRLAEALDDDIFITFREAGRDVFLACADLYPGHPIDIWTYPETYDGWHGTFFPQARFAKSFIREDYEDYYFMASPVGGTRDDAVQYMAHAEYIWNADAPDGSADFTVESRLYDVAGDVTDYQRQNLIPRIARRLYGEAGDVLAEVLAANISYNYVARPGPTTSSRGEEIEDTLRWMADQADVMSELAPKLATLLGRIDAGEVAGPHSADIRDDDGYRWAVFYYKYTGLGAVKARLEAQAARARELMEAGERQQAVEVAQEALDSLDEMARQVVDIHERVDATGVAMPTGSEACNILDTFAPADFAANLEQIIADAGAEHGD